MEEGSPSLCSADHSCSYLIRTTFLTCDSMKPTYPISRVEFHKHCPNGDQVIRTIAESISLTRKEFSTGSFGYAGTGKIEILVADTLVKCQISIAAIIVDSKHAK